MVARAGLPQGTYDAEAWAEYGRAPGSMRETAERRAAIARVLLTLGDDITWADRLKIVQDKFGLKGTSKVTLKRLLKDVEGVDPINFAPALLPSYEGRTVRAETTPEAWDTFLASVRLAAHSHSLRAVYDDIDEVAALKGWDWPSYPTILRRWNRLTAAERLTQHHGSTDAAKALYQPQRRDASKLSALQVVEMDGRTLDLWAIWPDGTIGRPTILALVDRASFKAMHFVIGKSETALLTRDLILQACDIYGIFDKLVTDNSRAFSSLLVAGGVMHKFRNAGTRRPEWEPPGTCEHLGITLKFNQPHNPGAKIPESKFAKWSRRIDTRPDFAGAHAGHNPGDKPSSDIVPVPIELVERIYRRDMAKDNARRGRRTQNARRGESYDQTFERLLEGRVKRPMIPRQRWRASLLYQVRKVDRLGQARVNGWVYGKDCEDGAQEYLLPY